MSAQLRLVYAVHLHQRASFQTGISRCHTEPIKAKQALDVGIPGLTFRCNPDSRDSGIHVRRLPDSMVFATLQKLLCCCRHETEPPNDSQEEFDETSHLIRHTIEPPVIRYVLSPDLTFVLYILTGAYFCSFVLSSEGSMTSMKDSDSIVSV